MSRRIDDDERRARLGRRHHLAARAPTVEAAAGDLLGLHSSDPTGVFLSAWARRGDGARPELEAALYDDRTLVRLMGMRRTLFVEPVDLAAVVQGACSRTIAKAERTRLLKAMRAGGVGGADPGRWLRRVERATLASVAARGEAAAAEVRGDVAALGKKVTMGSGRWATELTLGPRVLSLLAMDGRLVRGRARGTWISSQYRWSTTEAWLGASLPDLDPAAARTELVGRWLAAFGPAAVEDVTWWTGLTKAAVRAALAAVDAIEVELDDGPGWIRPDDVEPVAPPSPWVALLPSLDPTTMGWKQRGWYLGGHGPALFDRNGNAGPTVWVDGRVVGGWAQDPDGLVVCRFLEDVGSEVTAAVDAEAAALTRWFEGVRVTPRFRTPMERELSSGGP